MKPTASFAIVPAGSAKTVLSLLQRYHLFFWTQGIGGFPYRWATVAENAFKPPVSYPSVLYRDLLRILRVKSRAFLLPTEVVPYIFHYVKGARVMAYTVFSWWPLILFWSKHEQDVGSATRRLKNVIVNQSLEHSFITCPRTAGIRRSNEVSTGRLCRLNGLFLPTMSDVRFDRIKSLQLSEAFEALHPSCILEACINKRKNILAVDAKNDRATQSLLRLTSLCGTAVRGFESGGTTTFISVSEEAYWILLV